ncbi:DUF3519 domain-containing protein, partial [Helicobacter pylori]|uniref:DUF3519 domain-containing protein n=1 Tax=Helicobacter pylori TaxID=210 RepID=UPI001E55AD9C
MLITQDNDKILRTFILDIPERYVRNHVRDADIIHSFIQPNRTAKSDNALSDVVVYGENITQNPLTSQADLLKTQENPLKATAGAALKYHIKRALERSHSISDFSKQLELSAKNSKFTNNTL